MKTIILTTFLLAPLAGALDEPATLDANDFIASKIMAKPTEQHGKSVFQRGTIDIPCFTNLEATKTIKLQERISLTSRELHRRHMPGFRWAPGKSGAYLLMSEPKKGTKANSLFGTNLHNLTFTGGGVAAGGAQCSSFVNLRIMHAPVCFNLMEGSTRCRLADIDTSNHHSQAQDKREGTGIRIFSSRSIYGANLTSMGTKRGLVLDRSKNVTINCWTSEHCSIPITITNGSSNVTITGADLETSGEVVFDLTRNGGSIKITAVAIRKSPVEGTKIKKGPVYFLDYNGKKRLITASGRAALDNGVEFDFRTEGVGRGQSYFINDRKL